MSRRRTTCAQRTSDARLFVSCQCPLSSNAKGSPCKAKIFMRGSGSWSLTTQWALELTAGC
jgi:hypothetical protein